MNECNTIQDYIARLSSTTAPRISVHVTQLTVACFHTALDMAQHAQIEAAYGIVSPGTKANTCPTCAIYLACAARLAPNRHQHFRSMGSQTKTKSLIVRAELHKVESDTTRNNPSNNDTTIKLLCNQTAKFNNIEVE